MTSRARSAPTDAHTRVAGTPPRLVPGARVLLIGIGNDLRSDDGAGPHVARALAPRVSWDVHVAHGLTPELADDLARCDVAIFVDASADPALTHPRWTAPGVAAGRPGSPLLGHALDVPALLALTTLLHGRAPLATTLTLPAREFALGERFSPMAERGVRVAVDMLLDLARG